MGVKFAHGRRLLVGLSLCVGALLFPAVAAAAGPADLHVSFLRAPAMYAADTTIAVEARVRNRSGRCAAASTTRFFASSDGIRSRGDALLGERRTGRLCPGRVRALTPSLSLASLPAALDVFYLIACADARRVIAESNERNNCRASAQPLTRVTAVPETPPGFLANGVSRTHIRLTWVDGTIPEDGFRIERQPGSTGDFVLAKTVGPNATEATIGPVGQGDSYRVQSFNARGSSDFSSVVTTLPPPISLFLLPPSTLSWLTVPAAAFYVVRRGTTAGGPYSSVVSVPGSATVYGFSPDPPGPHYYVIQSGGALGSTSLYSVEVTGSD